MKMDFVNLLLEKIAINCYSEGRKYKKNPMTCYIKKIIYTCLVSCTLQTIVAASSDWREMWDQPPPTYPAPPTTPFKMKAWDDSFRKWGQQQQDGNNPVIRQTPIPGPHKDAKTYAANYSSLVADLKASRHIKSAASANANRALQAEKERTEALLRIETARREEAELRHRLEEAAKVLAEQRHQEEILARQEVERRHKLEEDARALAEQRQRDEEEAHRQSRIREEAVKAEKRIIEQQVSEARQRFDHLVEKVRHSGIDLVLLDAVLPPMKALSAAAAELNKKSRSLATFLQGYIFLLDEIKENESAGEQIKKDYTAVATALYEGSEHLSYNPGQVAEAAEKTRGTYDLAKRHKKTLPETFDEFKTLTVRRVKTIADYEDFMTTNLLTTMSDALERLDGKDSLQLSLDASATFQKFLESLTQQGACAPDLVTPVSREINEAIKRILAEIKKRNLELYRQYEPSLASEIAKVRRLPSLRKLNEVPSLVQLLEYHPAVFLLIDTNPSLEDLKEDLSKLTAEQLKALFVYLFDLSERFREVLQRYSELSHTRTKISESDIQQLTGIVKARILHAEKVGDYEPDPYQAATEKKEKLTVFYTKAQEFVSGKSYRETIKRRFATVYGPLASFVASCQRADLAAFKAERLSQRGAKGPIEETPTELAARQSLIDSIIGFQQRFLGLDISTLDNDQLTTVTQQFSEMKTAVEANGDRFKTNFTAFLKRQDPNYTAPTQVVVPRPVTASTTPSSTSSSSVIRIPPAPPGPPTRLPPPPPPMQRTGGSSSASSLAAPVDDRAALLGALTGANIPTQLIEFSRTLNPTQKGKWQTLDKKGKIKWMTTKTEP